MKSFLYGDDYILCDITYAAQYEQADACHSYSIIIKA